MNKNDMLTFMYFIEKSSKKRASTVEKFYDTWSDIAEEFYRLEMEDDVEDNV